MMKMRPRLSLMKKTNSSTHSLKIALSLSLALSFCLAAFGVLIFNPGSRAFAQQRAPIERIADGQVLNKSGGPLGGAVVYLKNARSNIVKTYIADDAGHFRFGGLSQNTDYELWADSNGIRSKSKTISSFDSENSFHFVLKVDSAK
jgi:hypothetical protein